MEPASKLTGRRMIGTIMMLGLLGQNLVWFGPSPVLAPIMEELGLTMGQGGLLLSVVNLQAALLGTLAGTLVVRLGVKPVFSMALLLLSLGSVGASLAGGFPGILFFRVVTGIGFSLCLPVSGSLVSAWFTPEERPWLNMVTAVLPYIATFAVFFFSPFVFVLTGSWRPVLLVQGLLLVPVLIGWMILGREPVALEPSHERGSKTLSQRAGILKAEWAEVLSRPDVWKLAVAEMGDMWSFQFLNSYLVVYFMKERGMDLPLANGWVSIFPVAGLVGGLLFGVIMGRSGRRRPFTWPFHLMIFAGTWLILTPFKALTLAGILLAGFGNAAWAPALYSMPMEFTGVTPRQVALIYGMVFAMGSLAAFLSPVIGGWLAATWNLSSVIRLFSLSSLLASFMLFAMRDTLDRRFLERNEVR